MEEGAGHGHAQRDDRVRTRGGDDVCVPRREASGDTSPAHPRTSDSPPLGHEEIHSCGLNHPRVLRDGGSPVRLRQLVC